MKFTHFASLVASAASAGVVSASPIAPPAGIVGAVPVAPPAGIVGAIPVRVAPRAGILGAIPVAPPTGILGAAPVSPAGIVKAAPVTPPVGIARALPVAPPTGILGAVPVAPPTGVVPVAPGAVLPHLASRCSVCDADSQALDLVSAFKADIKDNLAMLEGCRTTGSNPTDIFTNLVAKVDQYKNSMEALNATSLYSKPAVQAQAAGMAAQMILDIGNEYSKFANVKMDGFDYPALSYKADMALKGYCYALDGLMKGSLAMISSMCLPNAVTLWAANMKNCLTTFATNLV